MLIPRSGEANQAVRLAQKVYPPTNVNELRKLRLMQGGMKGAMK